MTETFEIFNQKQVQTMQQARTSAADRTATPGIEANTESSHRSPVP
jgi:hypothetical protein